MDHQAATGIATPILLIAFILLGATAASLLVGDIENDPNIKYEEMINETVDEISTYIQIKDVVGKYSYLNNERYIESIAVLIKPLFSSNIDITNLIIKINNGNQINMLYYNGNVEPIGSYSLFEHPIWEKIKENQFCLLSITDTDQSIIDYNTINDNTDISYILIKLSKDLAMKKGDMMELTLIPSQGIEKTINIEAPLPIKQIVTLN